MPGLDNLRQNEVADNWSDKLNLVKDLISKLDKTELKKQLNNWEFIWKIVDVTWQWVFDFAKQLANKTADKLSKSEIILIQVAWFISDKSIKVDGIIWSQTRWLISEFKSKSVGENVQSSPVASNSIPESVESGKDKHDKLWDGQFKIMNFCKNIAEWRWNPVENANSAIWIIRTLEQSWVDLTSHWILIPDNSEILSKLWINTSDKDFSSNVISSDPASNTIWVSLSFLKTSLSSLVNPVSNRVDNIWLQWWSVIESQWSVWTALNSVWNFVERNATSTIDYVNDQLNKIAEQDKTILELKKAWFDFGDDWLYLDWKLFYQNSADTEWYNFEKNQDGTYSVIVNHKTWSPETFVVSPDKGMKLMWPMEYINDLAEIWYNVDRSWISFGDRQMIKFDWVNSIRLTRNHIWNEFHVKFVQDWKPRDLKISHIWRV